ncbi:hypothetical protein C8Q78DRAFT_410312 [Trametes maxima]|nr:hypothetical protein C8Q78DRAFT_410312 [Trametes maxima]
MSSPLAGNTRNGGVSSSMAAVLASVIVLLPALIVVSSWCFCRLCHKHGLRSVPDRIQSPVAGPQRREENRGHVLDRLPRRNSFVEVVHLASVLPYPTLEESNIFSTPGGLHRKGMRELTDGTAARSPVPFSTDDDSSVDLSHLHVEDQPPPYDLHP